ncbi:MAG: nucleoside hydrolase [Verrucomicrobia bacterium]|nr:nucleoside hydrolase [Verrucomicrobiota bacterium]
MRPLLITLLFAFCSTQAATRAEQLPSSRIPVLYSSDLFHPHDDPDDHFDIATLYAIPEFDVRGIVLDQGALQISRPGSIPVAQLNALTGRNIPAAIGLASKLVSPTDPGLDQPEPFQGGVRLILDTLRSATRRVDIIAVGSMRDLAAAFNREPELFRQRAGRLLLFIGEASDPAFREHNVNLDPHAYVALMRSGLNLYWVPCFDGGLWRNAGHASFWQATHADLLHLAPPELVRFFIYALEKETTDPLAFLRQPVDPTRREKLFRQTRNLWCTAVFRALTVPDEPSGDGFEFETVKLSLGVDAALRSSTDFPATTVKRFKVRDAERYGPVMTQATAGILARFPVASGHSGHAHTQE